MAEMIFTRDVGEQDANPELESRAIGKTVNFLGAVASLALIAGIGVWGYKLVMRDVSGVPVVRAAQGPMRMQPENPGGRQADHQGLAVNAVAAQGTAAAPADRLLLAPRPVELADEDMPVGDAKPVVANATVTPPTSDPVTPSGQVAPKETLVAFQQGDVDQLVNSLIAGVAPMTDQADTADITEVAVEIPQVAALDPVDIKPEPEVVTGPGVRRSLRPHIRPARREERFINAAVKAAVAPEIDPDALPAGTRLAQLGAFDSADVARSEWDRLNGKFGDYLQGKSRVIQKATSGGRTFYRLRAMGFDDLSDARRFCSALVAEKADCIPVTIR